MNIRFEQFVLIMIVIGLSAALFLQVGQLEALPLWAQGEPTPTFTWTPTFTLTPTITPTPTITQTPSPTPTKGNVVEIEFPTPGIAVAGPIDIRGTALTDGYLKYDLHIANADSESWEWLTTSYDFVRGGVLYRLDTLEWADGFYDLRLRVVRLNGEYEEFYLRGFEIRNTNPPTTTPFVNPQGTFIPSSPLATPTPTPTPDFSVRIPGGQGFYRPAEGAEISGYTPIVATVNNLGDSFFQRYELFISPAGLEEWDLLIANDQEFWQDTIYVLDTTRYANAAYDLRLRIVYQDGNYSEYHLRNVQIRNSTGGGSMVNMTNGIYRPHDGAHVSGIVDFVGTAIGSDFLRWELYWSPGDAESWTFLVSDEQPILNGLLARLDLSQIPAGRYDFRLRVVNTDYNYTDYLVRRVQVVPLPTATPTPDSTLASP